MRTRKEIEFRIKSYRQAIVDEVKIGKEETKEIKGRLHELEWVLENPESSLGNAMTKLDNALVFLNDDRKEGAKGQIKKAMQEIQDVIEEILQT